MLHHRCCISLPLPSWRPPLRLAARQQTYSPSAWSAFTSASLSRHFHCTLKETVARSEGRSSSSNNTVNIKSSNSNNKSSSSRPVPVVLQQCVTSTPHHYVVTDTAADTARKTSSPQLPSLLQYSLELSLPHLPQRTPLPNSATITAADLHSNSSVKTTPREDVLRALAPWLAPQRDATTPVYKEEEMPPKWEAFVQLCDRVVCTAAAHRATGSASLCGVTVPCKEPYFSAGAAENASINPSSRSSRSSSDDASLPSTIQAAVWLFHRHWHLPVTLALNTTVANQSANSLAVNGDSDSGSGSGSGASADGVRAVVRNFADCLDGTAVLLVRGDSPSTQHGLPPSTLAAASAAPTAGVELRTSGDLVRCLRGAGVAMSVAGYPQGHPLDRQWESIAASCVTATTAPASAEVPDTFFSAFERDFNAADRLFDLVVEPHEAASPLATASSSPVQLPALRSLFRTLGRLHAVRLLWLTPSHYSAEARTAAVRQLVEDKVLLLPKKGEEEAVSTAEGARVVVTQMLTSAQEFTQFRTDVQRVLKAAAAAAASPLSPDVPSVKVVAGVLLPHPTDPHVLLRSLYYAKVIPSPRLQRALETYRTDLKSVWRSIVTHNNTTHDDGESGGGEEAAGVTHEQDVAEGYRSTWPGHVVLTGDAEAAAAVEAFVKDAHHRATARFTAAWMSETVELLRQLQQQQRLSFAGGSTRRDEDGATPVHFFTMFNDMVDVRLEQLLEAYTKRQSSSTQCSSSYRV